MGKHADGARAQGSDRHQQDGIDLVLPHQISNATGLILQGHRVVCPHEGIAVAGNAANDGLFRQLSKPVHRKDDVPIVLEASPVEVRRYVGQDEGVTQGCVSNVGQTTPSWNFRSAWLNWLRRTIALPPPLVYRHHSDCRTLTHAPVPVKTTGPQDRHEPGIGLLSSGVLRLQIGPLTSCARGTGVSSV